MYDFGQHFQRCSSDGYAQSPRPRHGTDGSLHTVIASNSRPYKSILPFAASAAGFVTFSKSNAKALLTAEPSKAHLRPTGWYGALPRCLRAAPQQGRPLKRAPCTPPKHCPVSVVTMVTVFLIPPHSQKHRHDRHHRHAPASCSVSVILLPVWLRLLS